jgi:inner membrane protein
MPSPIGHMIAGYVVYRTMQPSDTDGRQGPRFVLASALLSAVAADLDFLPGLLLSTPNHFHHGPSHSLGAALLYGLVVWMVLRGCRVALAWRLALLLASAYASHLVLDLLAVDTSPPFGIPLFWPVTSTYYISPVPLFTDIQRGDGAALTFVRSALNVHNLLAIAWEMVLLALIALWTRRSKGFTMLCKEVR